MSLELRILLLVFSLGSFWYIIRKIKKAQIKIEDSIFWIFAWGVIVLISIFPEMVYFLTNILGIISPVNFVYLVIIFVLLIKVFLMSIKLSQMENKIKNLAEEIAIKDVTILTEREKFDDTCGMEE